MEVLLNFELNLITDPNHPDQLLYPGSVLWRRRTSTLFNLFLVPFGNFNYNFVQIIDNAGNEIEPAFSEWVAWMKENSQNKVAFYRIQDERLQDTLDCHS